MRITRGAFGAIITLGKDSVLTKKATPDARDAYKEKNEIQRAAIEFCFKHRLGGYSVYACKAHGGFMVDDVDLDEGYLEEIGVRAPENYFDIE